MINAELLAAAAASRARLAAIEREYPDWEPGDFIRGAELEPA